MIRHAEARDAPRPASAAGRVRAPWPARCDRRRRSARAARRGSPRRPRRRRRDAPRPRRRPRPRVASGARLPASARARAASSAATRRPRVDRHGDAERQRNGARDRARRVADLLAQRRDPGIAGEREEQQPGDCKHAVEAARATVAARQVAAGPRRRCRGSRRRRPPAPRATARPGPAPGRRCA